MDISKKIFTAEMIIFSLILIIAGQKSIEQRNRKNENMETKTIEKNINEPIMEESSEKAELNSAFFKNPEVITKEDMVNIPTANMVWIGLSPINTDAFPEYDFSSTADDCKESLNIYDLLPGEKYLIEIQSSIKDESGSLIHVMSAGTFIAQGSEQLISQYVPTPIRDLSLQGIEIQSYTVVKRVKDYSKCHFTRRVTEDFCNIRYLNEDYQYEKGI